MIGLDDVRLFLPRYLSEPELSEFVTNLNGFPNNLDDRFFLSDRLSGRAILQGDGVPDLLVVSLPKEKVAPARCMVLSNSCDISQENYRLFSPMVCYAPILNLEKYEGALRARDIEENRIAGHLDAIRKQKVTQAFFLPRCAGLDHEGVVFLDRICHCRINDPPIDQWVGKRLFSLSNYGAWLLALKLSVHFCRLTDGARRDADDAA